MRNSPLVEGFCAENVTGLKSATEAVDLVLIRRGQMVEERSSCGEAMMRVVVERGEVRILE